MANLFNPLQYSSLFQEPRRISDVTGWQEHIPFAFMLIEMLKPKVFVELGTHKGDSYFAFCQAVESLGIDTTCYAVDTWAGDEQAGYYSGSIFEDIKRYHDLHYEKFSTLLRCTFDEALNKFPSNSIDLVHIDGLHTYEAVKHDFETWLSKMSINGVMLFHDISVKQRDFGVWKLWGELRNKYPSIEFEHGNGLGVIAVGSNVPKPLRELLSLRETDISKIQKFFYFMGSRITLPGIAKMQERQKVDAVLNSWSWKITKPMRLIRDVFKKKEKRWKF